MVILSNYVHYSLGFTIHMSNEDSKIYAIFHPILRNIGHLEILPDKFKNSLIAIKIEIC